MRYITSMICCLILSCTLFSQDSHIFIIRDSVSKSPIPYAAIRFLKLKKGTSTGVDGIITSSPKMDDTLFVSSIGYYDKIIAEKDIRNTTIFLSPKSNTLPDIKLKSRKYVGESEFGILKAAKTKIWSSGGFGDEFAQKIVFSDSGLIYKLKRVRIAAERFDETIPVLLHIYETDINGFPGQDILLKSISLKKEHYKKKMKVFEIDVQSENIFISQGSCFIGFEWIPVDNKGTKLPSSAITLTEDISEKLTLSRAFFWNNNKWSAAPSLPSQKNPTNTIISVLADVLK